MLTARRVLGRFSHPVAEVWQTWSPEMSMLPSCKSVSAKIFNLLLVFFSFIYIYFFFSLLRIRVSAKIPTPLDPYSRDTIRTDQKSHVHCRLVDVKQLSNVVRLHSGTVLWCSSCIKQSFISWLTFTESRPGEWVNYYKMIIRCNIQCDRGLFDPNPWCGVLFNPVNLNLVKLYGTLKGNNTQF